MKPIIILLLDRGFTPMTIKQLTGLSNAQIYYAKKKYESDLPALKEILNKSAKVV